MSRKPYISLRRPDPRQPSARDLPPPWKQGGFDLLAGAKQKLGDPRVPADPRRARRRDPGGGKGGGGTPARKGRP